MRASIINSAKRQKGISLIEVLVSMALGIFFLGVAVEYLITGQQSSSVQDSGSRIQENARFSISLLQDDIRLAGYNGSPGILAAPLGAIYQGNCNLSDPCTTDDVGNVGDRIAVSFLSDASIGEDCLGTAVAGGVRVANVYWVQEVGGINSLYCNGWNIDTQAWISAEQPLIDGIEQMQVQYGVATAAGNRFLSAAGVTASGDWGSVRSVRIALLVDSGLQTVSADTAGDQAFVDDDTTYAMLDGPDFQPSDGRIRRVYTTTIELNNEF